MRTTPNPTSLLLGPRGRRLLLEAALESERGRGPGPEVSSLANAVFYADYRMRADRGEGVALIASRGAAAPPPDVTPEDVAERLAEVPDLGELDATALRTVLARSVDAARYWQAPDGTDVVCEHPAVRRQLVRIAEQVSSSPATRWWATELDRDDQWALTWDAGHPCPSGEGPASVLAAWRADTIEGEAGAARDRPADPSAPWSGTWWSAPPIGVLRSARRLSGGEPAGLYLVEDGTGLAAASARRLRMPGDFPIVEIRGAADWAALCREHPVEVTAQKRHDWFRTTGRAGRWVVPDWVAVATTCAAVHLTVEGYLAAAGTVVEVDVEAASMIAGWNPDETFWLTDDVSPVGESRPWRRVADDRWEPID